MSQVVCEICGKPRPDKKQLFRDISILCRKQGYYVLNSIENTAQYCLCLHFEPQRFMSLRRIIRRQRSRVKRMMVFVAKYKPHLWKSKRYLLERNSNRSSRRQMDREDEVLWDVQSGWYLLDEGGRKHCLEDVLDTPMVREIINGLPQKSLKAMRALLSRLAYDPSLVGAAMLKPLVLPDWVRHIRCSDVENLYRAGVDDEWPDWVDASEIEEVEDSY